MSNINARFGVVDELARRLHELNVLQMTGNDNKALAAGRALTDELAGSHIDLFFAPETKEWMLCDTLLFDRETLPEED